MYACYSFLKELKFLVFKSKVFETTIKDNYLVLN